MKSRHYATIEDGEIVEWTTGTAMVELKENQIPLTEKEWAIISLLRGDLQYGKNIIRDIEERVAKVSNA